MGLRNVSSELFVSKSLGQKVKVHTVIQPPACASITPLKKRTAFITLVQCFCCLYIQILLFAVFFFCGIGDGEMALSHFDASPLFDSGEGE